MVKKFGTLPIDEKHVEIARWFKCRHIPGFFGAKARVYIRKYIREIRAEQKV